VNRKARGARNFGGTAQADDRRFNEQFFRGPQYAEIRTSIGMPERLIATVLRGEIERLRTDERERLRFFTHLFGPSVADGEVAQFVADYARNPPEVHLGFPRVGGTWPSMSIALSSDEEAEVPLGQFVGETLQDELAPGGEDQEYEGGLFSQVLSIYILSGHPDQCAYLYRLAKMILFGARAALTGAGLIEPSFGGGELNPEEMVLPENAFARVLTVRCKVMETVPRVLSYRDGRKLRVTGLFREDVVVDGLRGGVEPYTPGAGDDDEEG